MKFEHEPVIIRETDFKLKKISLNVCSSNRYALLCSKNRLIFVV